MPDPLYPAEPSEQARLRDRLLSATLDRVFPAHPFYRDRFAALGIARGDVTGVADLHRLPVTTKADYMADPERFIVQAEDTADPSESVIWDTMYTTGSSGRPAPFVSTSYDFTNILAVQRGMMRLRGVTGDDSILNLFPLTRTPHGAFTRAMNAAAAMGIPVTAALPGQVDPRRPETLRRLDDVVHLAARVRPTILWGVPSFLRKLVMRAEELAVRWPCVRLAFVTGEGFGEQARSDLVARLRRLGAPDPRISVSYGATEMQGGMVECREGSGYHNPAPDQFLFESVDPETLEPVEEGEEGLILLTHLDRRGTVMLRYALGDMARLVRGSCPHCGALTERLVSIPHRADGLVKVKGMLVNPQAVVDALMGVPGLVEFQAVVTREEPQDPLSMDRLVIEAVADANPDATLAATIVARVRAVCSVTPDVAWTVPERLSGRSGTWKAKPVLDLR